MKKEVFLWIIYILVSIIIMAILLSQLSRSYEVAQSTYIITGYVRLRYIVFTIFGVLLGLHNVIGYIKNQGKWKVNYYVVAFSLISFLIGYSLLLNINVIYSYLLGLNIGMIEVYIIIVFGYSLTLIMQKRKKIDY